MNTIDIKTMKNILFILVIIFTGHALAQDVPFDKSAFGDKKDGLKEAKKELKEGNDYFEMGPIHYKDAIPFYEKAQKFNPNNSGLNYKLGVCYLTSMYKYKALSFLEKSVELNSTSAPKDLNYHLGRAYHLDNQFNKAITAYSKYQRIVQSDTYALEEIRLKMKQCDNAKKLVKEPVRVFVDNLGSSLNSEYNEYGASISADESVIVFTARRPNSTGGKIDENLNENFEDIYISYKDENGNWGEAKNVGEPVNTSNHDANSGISADGQRFIIYLGKKNGGDLFESTLTGDIWSKPESFGKNINTDYHESSAAYAPDGRSIYFVSDKPGGLGEHDIYVSHLDEKGKWGKSVSLGNVINTKYEEEAVFMHPDGKTLYFSSMGHSSMGGYDIFKSIYDEKMKTWSDPQNLGYPVNTADDDIFFVISASGRHGYYTSMNADTKGLRDLYIITFLGPEKPMLLNTEDVLLASVAAPVQEVVIAPTIEVKEAQLTILKGTISDFLTDEKLEAEIEIVDNDANKVIATFKSNSKTGKYLVSLPAGKNYGIAVKKEGYLFHSENFDIPATAAFQEVEKNVKLKMLSVGNKIVLRNIFFDLSKATLRPESTAELNRLIKLMTDVPTLRIELGGHTDAQGSDSYNMTLSDQRAKAVVDYLSKNGIDAGRLEFNGYGETELVNGCKNGVNCSPEQHQMNRRTEFRVLSF